MRNSVSQISATSQSNGYPNLPCDYSKIPLTIRYHRRPCEFVRHAAFFSYFPLFKIEPRFVALPGYPMNLNQRLTKESRRGHSL